jgi:hypothetical protein
MIMSRSKHPLRSLALALSLVPATHVQAVPVTGEVVDSRAGHLIPARLYIQGEDGRWFFAESGSPDGSAIRYEKRNWINTNAIEMHVTLSAHSFRVELPPGGYTFTVERGKEYRPLVRRVEVTAGPVRLRLPLHRWIDMAGRGWFCGDTHVHRTLADLSNVVLAEDVNVAFPLTYWVTKAFTPPTQGDRNIEILTRPAGTVSLSEGVRGSSRPNRLARRDGAIRVDSTHVIWPRNTEWEIFTVGDQRHHLGAVFALGHKSAFTLGAPPVTPIARQARREGALLDLDKHDWPWSMMLVPVMGVDLYELANNHIWRTEFGFSKWNSAAGNFMGLPGDGWSGTERDWIEYGCRNYYTLLDCGFRLRPSAGTANGVHPVPLGFGRVYVHCPRGFSYKVWRRGLDEGRSFVTTGPMLLAEVDGRPPGARVTMKPGKSRRVEVAGLALSDEPVNAVEIILNGEVAHRSIPTPRKNRDGAHETKFHQAIELTGSSWIAVRCWEPRAGGRIRFAHTAPWFFDVPGAPLSPRREKIDFLIRRVREQIERSSGVLPAEAMAEYQKALAIYEDIALQAP